jgi:hypothetical protein
VLHEAKRSDALQTRDRYELRVCDDPGSAVHHFVLHRIRETVLSYVSIPTIAPSKHVVSVPDTIDFKPSDTTSSRFSGHMVESPAIMMPSEPKLAKPHMA